MTEQLRPGRRMLLEGHPVSVVGFIRRGRAGGWVLVEYVGPNGARRYVRASKLQPVGETST